MKAKDSVDSGPRMLHPHRKLENSHLLATGSAPPEKTIRVKKDNMILGHLNRYRFFFSHDKL
jgi:hypothetical protein